MTHEGRRFRSPPRVRGYARPRHESRLANPRSDPARPGHFRSPATPARPPRAGRRVSRRVCPNAQRCAPHRASSRARGDGRTCRCPRHARPRLRARGPNTAAASRRSSTPTPAIGVRRNGLCGRRHREHRAREAERRHESAGHPSFGLPGQRAKRHERHIAQDRVEPRPKPVQPEIVREPLRARQSHPRRVIVDLPGVHPEDRRASRAGSGLELADRRAG